MAYKTFFIASILIALSGCAGAPLSRDFDRIRPGMEKDEVLLIMGSPKNVRRVKTRDYYTYKFYENDTAQFREIQFEEGQVIYAGDLTKPAESAEEADERIQRENEADQAKQRAEREQRKANPPNLEKEILGEPKSRKMPVYRKL